MIIPFVASVTNTVFCSDDFSFANHLLEYRNETGNWILGLLKFVYSHWIGWSGRWICALFPVSINPLVITSNPFFWLKIYMSVSFMAFTALFIYLIKTILEELFHIHNKKLIFAIALAFLAVLLNTYIYTEIFYWLTGANYIFLMGCEMLGIAYGIKYYVNGNGDKYTMRFAIAGFCSCDNLHGIAPVFLLVIYFGYKKLKNREFRKKDAMLAFLFCISSASNVLAPGNFVRHEVIDSTGLHPFVSILYTLYSMLRTSLQILSLYPVIIFILCMGMLGAVLYIRGIECHSKLGLLCLYTPLCIFGAMYPVSLGYSNVSYPNRIVFVFSLHFIILLGLLCMSVGSAAIALFREIDAQSLYRAFIFVVAICVLSSGMWIEESPYYIIVTNYFQDKYVCDQWRYIFRQIEESADEDVTINLIGINESKSVMPPGFSIDFNSSVNAEIAKYFGKKSITVIGE